VLWPQVADRLGSVGRRLLRRDSKGAAAVEPLSEPEEVPVAAPAAAAPSAAAAPAAKKKGWF
jgi:hypothetical protein